MTTVDAERDGLVRTIATLEGQRAVLGDAAVQLALAPIRARLAEIEGGAPPLAAGAPAQAPGRKVVTVLFVDIAGFTAMSERLDPERLREIMNGCFDRMVPVIARYGGVVDKFMGDGLMALFGVPKATEHHADHALRTCIDLFDALDAFNRERGLALGMHIGVNSGLVVAGGMGSVDRQDYSVLGDVVNVAARLEDASQPGEILVGPATHRLTSRQFEFEALEPIPLKGKAQRLPVYRLVGLRARQNPTEAQPNRVSMRIAGRRLETGALVAAAARARQGEGGAVAIAGDPGLGKSTLVEELRSRVSESMTWWETGGQAHRGEVSHGVVQGLLERMIDAPGNGERGNLTALLEHYLEDLLGNRAPEVLPYLLRLCAMPVPQQSRSLLDDLSPEALRQRMWNAAFETLGAACRSRPVVVAIEDLHWADPSSIDWIRELARHAAAWPMLIIVTTRSDASRVVPLLEDLEGSEAGRVLRLQPLPEAAVRTLMDELLSTSERAPLLRDRIVAKAEGNPFYLVSFLQLLVDEEVGVLRNGRVEVDGPAEHLDLPDSLHALIASRIENADAPSKQVLRLASVLGRSFTRDLLGKLQVAETGRPEAVDVLERLVTRNLLEGQPGESFRFSHAIVREVAYYDMLASDRRRLHGFVAGLLLAQGGDITEQSVALLAWHHEHAEQPREASRCYEHAAELAQRTHANDEALSYLAAAMRLAEVTEPERILSLRERSGDLQHLMGRFESAGDEYRAIAGLIDPDEDPVPAARLRRKVARTLLPQQRAPDALDQLREADAMLERQPAPLRDAAWWQERLEAGLEKMMLFYITARSQELIELARVLEPDIRAHGSPAQALHFERNRVLLELRQRRFRVGPAIVAQTAKGLEAIVGIEDQALVTSVLFSHAFALLWSGEIEQAETSLRRVLANATRIGHGEWTVLSLTYLAVTARFRHDADSARAFALAAQSAARANRSPMYVDVATVNIAWAAWLKGDIDPNGADAGNVLAPYGNYPLQWLHQFVELARALSQPLPHVPRALMAVQVMMQPSQQLLRADVQETLERAANATPDERLPALRELVKAASEAGYL